MYASSSKTWGTCSAWLKYDWPGVTAALPTPLQQWLQQWVVSGGLVDTIIVITLLEVAVLLVYHHQTKRGLKPRDYLLNVVSGLCLMLALRCALLGSTWYFVAVFLSGAGLAHTADIARRLQQRAQST